MIVCVCHNISERQIEQALYEGAESVETLSARLGACTGCGCCRETCQDLVDRHQALGTLPIAA